MSHPALTAAVEPGWDEGAGALLDACESVALPLTLWPLLDEGARSVARRKFDISEFPDREEHGFARMVIYAVVVG